MTSECDRLAMRTVFDQCYSHTDRPSIPPEQLLRRGKGYAMSLRRRKMIEEAFGWIRATRGSGAVCVCSFNLTRLAKPMRPVAA